MYHLSLSLCAFIASFILYFIIYIIICFLGIVVKFSLAGQSDWFNGDPVT